MGNLDVHIGEILARNARLYPNDVALIETVPAEGKRREITWKQFDEGAKRFANILLKKGIKKGDKVIHLMMLLTRLMNQKLLWSELAQV